MRWELLRATDLGGYLVVNSSTSRGEIEELKERLEATTGYYYWIRTIMATEEPV